MTRANIFKTNKVRLTINRTSSNTFRPNYILFFAEKNEVFQYNLVDAPPSTPTQSHTHRVGSATSKRAPNVSKLGVLHIEPMAVESETAKEHLPERNQTDYSKNKWAQRILEKMNVSHKLCVMPRYIYLILERVKSYGSS